MKNPDKTNITNKLTSHQEDAPSKQYFDDIDCNNESGTLQSDFIFIQKNQIKHRLASADKTFTIAETGFGTGLNFLLTLQAYQEVQQDSDREIAPLHFISVEKYPLSKAQLKHSLSILPHLQTLSHSLVDNYPEVLPDAFPQEIQMNFLNNQVRLTLIVNDTAQALSSLRSLKQGLVDAWYLNGLSPAKNPKLWNKELFTHIGRLSKEQATLTTLTIVDFVTSHLSDTGFRLEKVLVPGNKKEILFGKMQQNPLTRKGYQLRPHIKKPQHVSIIGGGIASACAAYALTKQGVKVTLYCKDMTVAQGGSSNAIGALYPLLHQQADDISNFYQQAFWRAKALYTEIAEQGFSFSHQWCGLLEVSYKEALVKRQQAFEKLNTWPAALIHGVDAAVASKFASIDLPYGGLYMPNAGWISPKELVEQIFQAAKTSNLLKIKTDTHITKIRQVNDSSWCLSSNQGEFNASVLVICGGADSIEIEQLNALPLTATRGQITSMASNPKINKLSTVICHKGYLTPENKGIHCIGATFQKNDTNLIAEKADDEYNLAMLNKCMPELSSKINWQEQDIASSKARLRCMSQDHLPLVGAVPKIEEHMQTYAHLGKDKNWKYSEAPPCIDNLYVLLGLGARGLCSAPLAADILTAELCNTPYPMDNQMIFNLSPNRFIIRDIIKRKTPQKAPSN
jgi:tRNA 5-methylaminomethyl-2-thiouridine biosynthesis bifunctional protein